MHKLPVVLLFLSFVAYHPLLKAQNSDCQNSLNKARELFNNAEFDEVIQLYESKLMACSFTKAEQQEALKLAASSYYEIDEIESGNEIMRKFLRNSPNYLANPNLDPVSFAKAYHTFRIFPRLAFGINAGTNSDKILVSKIYAVNDSLNYTLPYKSALKPVVHFFVRWYPVHFLSISTGIGYVSHSYTRQITGNHSLNVLLTENYVHLNTPLTLYLHPFRTGNFIPSVYGGVYRNTAINADYTSIMEVADAKGQTLTYEYAGEMNTNYRNLKQNGLLLGANLAYKFNTVYFFADAKYNLPLSDFSTELRHPSIQLPINQSILSDDFKLTSFEISIGLQINLLYNVRLLK